MIIGGLRSIDFGGDGQPGGGDDNPEALASVEIFGCPQNPFGTVRKWLLFLEITTLFPLNCSLKSLILIALVAI